MMRRTAVLILLVACVLGATRSMREANDMATPVHTLMPVPAAITFGEGHLAIDSSFHAEFTGYSEPRLERAVARMMDRLSRETGIYLGMAPDVGQRITLDIECSGPGSAVQSAFVDESYTLIVTSEGARLQAPEPYGVLHGLETFLQLVGPGAGGFQVPAVDIEDRPRFPWRGLLIDVARHWIPPEVIKRNLDGMAALKMNVLHWHLTEDQGFRIESKKYPRLHELGSDGRYFTQEQVREIVEYARDRGIRVVPEFDMPGHTSSWFVGHPELASAPGPYAIQRHWGVMEAAMDPTREEVYEFLDAFIGEMAELFPDPYMHIGGDEVNGKQWDANGDIQDFMREHGMADNHDLQAYFNGRIQAILAGHGKSMVGWDEIFHPELPQDIVIQSWRGQQSLAETARRGYQGILSNGYYLDHIRPASFHYGIDPLGEHAAGLSEEERARVLGGEACMWAEFVTFETIDSRIWPRSAAIAERLWSPAEVSDVDDMYRRLALTSRRLETFGLTHRSSYEPMLRRLIGNQGYGGRASYSIETVDEAYKSLKTLADVLEPVKFYRRPASRRYTSLMPLNRLVDAARPESEVAREFSQLVDSLLVRWPADPRLRGAYAVPVFGWLHRWREAGAVLSEQLGHWPLLAEVEPLARDLADLADLGSAALNRMGARRGVPESERAPELEVLERVAESHAELLIVLVPAVRRIVEASHQLPVR